MKSKHEQLFEEIPISEDITTLRKSKVVSFKLKTKNLKEIKRNCLEKKPQILLIILSITLVSLVIYLIIKLKPLFTSGVDKMPPLREPALLTDHLDSYRIIAINYANKKYDKAQEWNTKSALEIGQVDGVINYSPEYIDEKFKKKNKKIFAQYRGNGFYLWKPYFIFKAMTERLNTGDYLIYTDSDSVYINSTDYFVTIMQKKNLNIMAFNLEGSGKFLEKYYTKRDTFVLMDCDSEKYTETYQFLSTHIIFRKSLESLKFVEQWLNYAQDERIITDMINTLGFPNYQGFIDHRHDQSIFSLLAKKINLEKFRNPTQWGGYKTLNDREEKEGNDFPIMFYEHGRNMDNWDKIYDPKLNKYLEMIQFFKGEKTKNSNSFNENDFNIE